MKVQQQWMLNQEKSDEKRNTKKNSDGRQIGQNSAHFTNQITENKCYFCDETDNLLQQLVQEEQKFFSISAARNLFK